MNHPEEGVERAQAFNAHVEDNARAKEAREDEQWQP
jgi:hypothetical protein